MPLGVEATVDMAKVERQLLELAEKYPEAAATAIYQEGQALLYDSKQEVPVKYGDLRRSGYVDAPSSADGEATVVVGYGKDYALPVHERVEVFHKVGKSKFLIDPMLRRLAGYKPRMAKRIAQNARDGVTLGQAKGAGSGGDE